MFFVHRCPIATFSIFAITLALTAALCKYHRVIWPPALAWHHHMMPFSSRARWWEPNLPPHPFPKSNRTTAFWALQAWKNKITHDPNNITATWVGPNVCNYHGVYCAPPPDFSCDSVVAGIDLNSQNISGTLPDELGNLGYLSLFHINSNRFTGCLPSSLSSWTYLYELDVSNNMFEGGFPTFVLSLPSLVYLDIRFNRFSGELPEGLFTKALDAIFINNNNFSGEMPLNLQTSPASVMVLAHNAISGEIPASLSGLSFSLNELILLGNSLEACIPTQLGELTQLTVLDLSHNNLIGALPSSFGNLVNLEELNVANNFLCGSIPSQLCALPNLQNFTTSFNYFNDKGSNCSTPMLPPKKVVFDDTHNCIDESVLQREKEECIAFLKGKESTCMAVAPPPPPSPPPPPPPRPPPTPCPPSRPSPNPSPHLSLPPLISYHYPSPPPYAYPSPPPPFTQSGLSSPSLNQPTKVSSNLP